ncbi:DUF3467 domain-containing protein [Mariprofundus erugo]|uniref:DUF3467 domain-containing protein n=1 Tax=Mariprofundus erugo TaxID=2528639 RepID=A0A5R9GS93_9PROT|nr:DUF3467 domain-containing protein [Mariprofundus erugo]TLS67819.1 DUF3467 domain-containing protein [Mariprofundus erugo]TLS75941.1 DUF3467 domain-containing protein [Mariprofundus erugo]
MSDREDSQHEMQIQFPAEIQRGVYANQMVVTHTREEFVLDFILATPPVGLVNARVLVSPSHAKRIVSILNENISRYESAYGEIKTVAPLKTPSSVTTH